MREFPAKTTGPDRDEFSPNTSAPVRVSWLELAPLIVKLLASEIPPVSRRALPFETTTGPEPSASPCVTWARAFRKVVPPV